MNRISISFSILFALAGVAIVIFLFGRSSPKKVKNTPATTTQSTGSKPGILGQVAKSIPILGGLFDSDGDLVDPIYTSLEPT